MLSFPKKDAPYLSQRLHLYTAVYSVILYRTVIFVRPIDHRDRFWGKITKSLLQIASCGPVTKRVTSPRHQKCVTVCGTWHTVIRTKICFSKFHQNPSVCNYVPYNNIFGEVKDSFSTILDYNKPKRLLIKPCVLLWFFINPWKFTWNFWWLCNHLFIVSN